uniref:spermidine synthase n=1 Tax=Pseudonocardia nigra TaxID=1921578 RepID=UPI001C5EF6BF
DGPLVEFVRRELPPDRTWRLKVRTGDAREVLARAPGGAFDLVVVDVFAGARTPAHLTSVEFLQEVARALDDGGLWAANITDGAGSLAFARAQVATARAVFPHTALITEPAVLRGRRFGNLILLGSARELPIAELTTAIGRDPFPGRVEHGPPLERFTGGARPVTDATAADSPAPPDGTF